ncbi:unnamed protein product [Staurois parvus]|uniref:Uncharacterized protein n=1 Tax=Staurois parvus TaxID=386267 RepID=A0ABN9AQ89_9NEOB|nr:unnamed protein product [Staurois parvus]
MAPTILACARSLEAHGTAIRSGLMFINGARHFGLCALPRLCAIWCPL